MNYYSVTVPIKGTAVIEVAAEDLEAAKQKAILGVNTWLENLEIDEPEELYIDELEATEQIKPGGMTTEFISAKQIYK